MSAPGESERRDRLRLARSENVGPATYHALLARFGSAAAALEALPELSAKGGLGRHIRIAAAEDAERERAAADRLGLALIFHGDSGYPEALGHIETAPPLFYLAGSAEMLSRPAVAMVGARNCSAAGRRIAKEIAAGISQAGLVVVSGLARGIDAAAHHASLPGGTVAVLAGGHDRIYPPDHAELAREIASNGALVSEMPPGATARGRDFPRRNRIISGLSQGVVVVEAAARSGSLITARFALEQGRDVFAVPGSPLDPRAEGCNRLIRQGAMLTRSAEDIIEALQTGLPARPAPPSLGARDDSPASPAPDDARRSLLAALGPSPIEIDEIVRQTELPAGTVMQGLLELELAGRLERHPGQRVSLI